MKNKLLHKIFNAKILLFGEHIIHKGAMGLAVPVEYYHGLFKISRDLSKAVEKKSNHSLEQLTHYIIHHPQLGPLFDTNQMLGDIERGLYFDSNIPEGFGLGSSGALVAAIYAQYRKKGKKPFNVADAKRELAMVENYFHGSSSGLDPIVCLLNKSVLIVKGEVAEAFDLKASANPQLKVFLLNTHIERKTAPFVNLFLEKCNEPEFLNTIENSLIPANNIAVDSFLKKKYTQLMKSLHILSQLQYDLLPEFIPPKFKGYWRDGLIHNEYHLKICGGGGGGFIIGIARIETNLQALLKDADIIELLRF